MYCPNPKTGQRIVLYNQRKHHRTFYGLDFDFILYQNEWNFVELANNTHAYRHTLGTYMWKKYIIMLVQQFILPSHIEFFFFAYKLCKINLLIFNCQTLLIVWKCCKAQTYGKIMERKIMFCWQKWIIEWISSLGGQQDNLLGVDNKYMCKNGVLINDFML